MVRVLLSIDVFFGVVVLFLYNRVDEDLVWIGNIILWAVLAVALTAMIISDHDDILFSEAGEKSQEVVQAADLYLIYTKSSLGEVQFNVASGIEVYGLAKAQHENEDDYVGETLMAQKYVQLLKELPNYLCQ